MNKLRLEKGRRRAIYVNCDVCIGSTKTISSNMVENILWKLGDLFINDKSHVGGVVILIHSM